jgi:hypothetical protein
MQQFLKPTAGIARAGIIPPEFFEEFLVPVNDAVTAFYPGFGRESLSTFTRRLESKMRRGVWAWYSWHTSIVENIPSAGLVIIPNEFPDAPPSITAMDTLSGN